MAKIIGEKTKQEEKLKKQQEAVTEIKKLLEENDLRLVVQQLIQVVPKK